MLPSFRCGPRPPDFRCFGLFPPLFLGGRLNSLSLPEFFYSALDVILLTLQFIDDEAQFAHTYIYLYYRALSPRSKRALRSQDHEPILGAATESTNRFHRIAWRTDTQDETKPAEGSLRQRSR
jgi:hypothetical protein